MKFYALIFASLALSHGAQADIRVDDSGDVIRVKTDRTAAGEMIGFSRCTQDGTCHRVGRRTAYSKPLLLETRKVMDLKSGWGAMGFSVVALGRTPWTELCGTQGGVITSFSQFQALQDAVLENRNMDFGKSEPRVFLSINELEDFLRKALENAERIARFGGAEKCEAEIQRIKDSR